MVIYGLKVSNESYVFFKGQANLPKTVPMLNEFFRLQSDYPTPDQLKMGQK